MCPTWISRTFLLALLAFLPACHDGDFEPVDPDDTMRSGINLGRDPSYKLGTEINFARGGNSANFELAGWGLTEEEYTWTDGTSALLIFKKIPLQGPLELKATLRGATSAGVLHQPVQVLANGIKIADWRVGPQTEFVALLPESIDRSKQRLRIELRIPLAFSPKSVGLGEDVRILGVACYRLKIDRPAR